MVEVKHGSFWEYERFIRSFYSLIASICQFLSFSIPSTSNLFFSSLSLLPIFFILQPFTKQPWKGQNVCCWLAFLCILLRFPLSILSPLLSFHMTFILFIFFDFLLSWPSIYLLYLSILFIWGPSLLFFLFVTPFLLFLLLLYLYLSLFILSLYVVSCFISLFLVLHSPYILFRLSSSPLS